MTKAERTFDMVHGTQRIYRHLLECICKTGSDSEYPRLDRDDGTGPRALPVLAAVAFTLIDREVSFHLMCERSDDARKFLQWKTFSRHRPLPDANSDALIQRRLNGRDVREVMAQVKRGTLVYPHLSATVILLVTHVSEAGRRRVGPALERTGHKRAEDVSRERVASGMARRAAVSS